MKPVIAVTIGDSNGIGPEIALKSVRHPAVVRCCRPLLVGPPDAWRFWQKRLRNAPALAVVDRAELDSPRRGKLPIFAPSTTTPLTVRPGYIDGRSGEAAARAIECAGALVLNGIAAAMVTAPVSKRALHLGGFNFPGQTEMLQQLTGSRDVAMMLVSPRLKVGLVTIHLPLRQVVRAITRERVRRTTSLIHEALRIDWGVSSPRIAVLGLNPHAGEDGDLGTEESTIITPALRSLRRSGIQCGGPFPADAFFAHGEQNRWDAVVAMYHDQGLIPLKQTAGGKAVNYSAGLPIVRTSPGHGTAMDIAGKGTASPSGMVEAILLAAAIARNRQCHGTRNRR